MRQQTEVVGEVEHLAYSKDDAFENHQQAVQHIAEKRLEPS